MSLLEKLFHEENYNHGALSLPDLHYAQFPKNREILSATIIHKLFETNSGFHVK